VVHLIHLNRRSLQLQTFGQKTPNLAEHAPRCFVGDARFALNLLCGDTAARRTHKVHGIEPSLERGARLLKDGAHERIDVIPTGLAGIRGAIAHAVMLSLFAALLALRHSPGIPLLFDVL
jgi:hypothetical protein